jgi:signal transduction histidine kinase/CheY-like chemotaxis protein
MKEFTSRFESELRLSPAPVIISLLVLTMVIQFVTRNESDAYRRFNIDIFIVLLYALYAVALLLNRWRSWPGRWFVVITIFAAIAIANGWSIVPGILTLMAIPSGLAAALISFPAAVAIGLGETILLALLPKYVAGGADPTTVGVAVAAIWATLGVVYAVCRPAHQFAFWTWEYYRRSRCMLDEARDHQGELRKALDDLMRANRQLDLLNEKLATFRLMAEEAQKTKTAFVAKVSHEFRTPLNMIIGLVGLMIENPEVYGQELPPAVMEDLEIVHRNCEHLSSMVNDVLALSQAEAGRLKLHRERIDLAEVTDEALLVVRPLLEKKGLGLQVCIPEGLPKVYCDRTRIRQVILNLMSNAARFTQEGGITLDVMLQDGNCVVSVTDTGPGISSEDAETIFEPFCQGASGLWRDKGGSGLGLSISKQFVELHGGRIWLESEPGVGSTFSFQLPITPPMPATSTPKRWIDENWVWTERTSKPETPQQPRKKRIVICDESGELYPMIDHYSDDVELVNTRDMTQASRELQAYPAHAVIMNSESQQDLRAKTEAARLQWQDTPIIGCSVSPPIKRSLEKGAVSYLIKPIRADDIERAILGLGVPVRRVLLVDDDPHVLQLFSRMLHAYDETLEITTASNGEQALIELHNRPPDLMLLDIVMPEKDGWQVLEIKSQHNAIKDIPVIIVSAQDPAEEPPSTEAVLLTMGEGLSLSKLLRCALDFSTILLQPASEPDRVPAGTVDAAPV